MTNDHKQKCPDCGNVSVRKRAISTRGNVKRRSIEEKHHRFVCDNNSCSWSGTNKDIDWEEEVAEADNALDW